MKIKDIKRFDRIFISVFLLLILITSFKSGVHNTINIQGLSLDMFYFSLIVSVIGACFVTTVRLQLNISMLLGALYSLGYCFIAYINGNYGDFTINLYGTVLCLYSFIINKKGEFVFKPLEKYKKIALIPFTIIVYVILYYILKCAGTSNLIIDTLITTLIIITNPLMTFKYKVCWIGFDIINLLHVLLWGSRVISGVPNAAPLFIMFMMYLINSLIATKQIYKK